jgi:hypothetical protein
MSWAPLFLLGFACFGQVARAAQGHRFGSRSTGWSRRGAARSACMLALRAWLPALMAWLVPQIPSSTGATAAAANIWQVRRARHWAAPAPQAPGRRRAKLCPHGGGILEASARSRCSPGSWLPRQFSGLCSARHQRRRDFAYVASATLLSRAARGH